LERAIVEAAGRRVFVEHLRRPGPVRGTVLFVNGAVATTSALRWAVKGLTDFDLVMFDFPNLGASKAHNGELCALTKEAEAQIVLAVIERFRPEFLASQSWGGTSALLALAARPPSVQRAAIACYSAGLTDPMRALTDALLQAVGRCDRDLATELVLDALGERLPPVGRRLHERYFSRFGAQDMAVIARQLAYVGELCFREEVAGLAGIDIPVLFMNGSADRFTPPASVLPLARAVADARFAVVPGAGHFLAMEGGQICERVLQLTADFFTSEAADRASTRLRRSA